MSRSTLNATANAPKSLLDSHRAKSTLTVKFVRANSAWSVTAQKPFDSH
jgi:hypothetical protein